MKKTYQIPTLHIIKIQTPKIMSASPGYTTTKKTSATSGNLSRRGGFVWDDDEDE